MFLETRSLEDFITRYQVDGVLWKANRLLSNLDNPILRNDKCVEIATMLSLIPDSSSVMRDDYIKKICVEHNLKPKTLEKMISEVTARKVKATNKKVRKNKVKALDNDPKKFPFFREFMTENKDTGERSLSKIKIDKLRFVQLLSSFGFSRYETGTEENGDYNFVRIHENVISSVTRDKIIDYVENFIRNDYDFEAAKCEVVDADALITSMYDQIRTIFSKDLFARVRLDAPIIISKDKATITYLYFKNGFVEITADGYKLMPYEQLEGSVWDHQLKDRQFKKLEDPGEEIIHETESKEPRQDYKCFFNDFVWKISGETEERFASLCSIIGYMVHDYYEYNLKMPYFTDSTISDNSEGRTGKTLMMKMVGEVRSYCEINGKYFNPHDDKRYETVKLGTQLVHINDVSNKGKNRFEFEPMFNDITEGLHVRALYMAPFRQRTKIATSGNKSLFVAGDSAAARLIEYEMSNFFSINRRPDQFYKHWFGRDWDKEEWNRFDNFICYCAQMFHVHGLKEPPVINLLERKLRDHTANEFLEWMDEIKVTLEKFGKPWNDYVNDPPSINQNLTYQLAEFIFDRKKMFDRFIHEYPDFKTNWFTVRKFNSWIDAFCDLRLKVKPPKVWKSGGITFIQFVKSE